MQVFPFAGNAGHIAADAGKLAVDAVYFAAVGGKIKSKWRKRIDERKSHPFPTLPAVKNSGNPLRRELPLSLLC